MYRAIDLAKYIVSKCIRDRYPISNMQLQVILYCIQENYLSRRDQAFGDVIEMRQFGPIIPDVFDHYCGFGCMPISFSMETFEVDPEDQTCIDPIVDRIRTLTPWDLRKEYA